MKDYKNNFTSDLLWNYGSIVFLASSGLIFNTIIMLFYNAEILGVFSQVYAYYILFSQLTVFGIQASVTKYSSQYSDDKKLCGQIFISGICCVVIIALVVIGGLYAIVSWLQRYIGSEILEGIKIVIPGLFLFSINKVILGFLNGRSCMKAYAIFQSLRYILIAFILLLLAVCHIEGAHLVVCFVFSETVLSICLVVYLLRHKLGGERPAWKYIKEHIRFGFCILPGNMVLEFNAKTDIIALGLVLADDRLIGYYSFASFFAEGFYQLFIVVRRNINPYIAKLNGNNYVAESFSDLKDKVGHYVAVFALPGVTAIICGFGGLCWLMNRMEYLEALIPLLIISISIAVNGKYIIFGNLLSQMGFPMQESLINIGTVSCNMILNMVLIYLFGLIGVAVATAISYFLASVFIHFLVKKKLLICL